MKSTITDQAIVKDYYNVIEELFIIINDIRNRDARYDLRINDGHLYTKKLKINRLVKELLIYGLKANLKIDKMANPDKDKDARRIIKIERSPHEQLQYINKLTNKLIKETPIVWKQDLVNMPLLIREWSKATKTKINDNYRGKIVEDFMFIIRTKKYIDFKELKIKNKKKIKPIIKARYTTL